MSHVLGLLFEYHRYKKDTILRVYADDLLVEEILLTKDISVKSKESIKRPPIIVPGPPINRIELPEKLFLFEIDESNLKKSIRIEAINDNNNYTNGFMTDFSYLSFHGLFLIPRCLLYEDNWRKLARFINKKWDTEDPKEIANLANLSHHDFNWFPDRGQGVDHFIVKSSSNPWEGNFLWHKRGGSFNVEIPLFRKHGQIHIVRPKAGRMDLQRYPFKILCWFNKLNMST